MKQITVQDIKIFQSAAKQAGDHLLVARCARAIAGEQDAWWLVRSAINSAKR